MPSSPSAPVSRSEAARFLTQSTYGPTTTDIDRLSQIGYAAWLDEQFAKPQSLHRAYLDQMAGNLTAAGSTVSQTTFRESYWAQAITGGDQLRQRAAFALSQIFVVSFVDQSLAKLPRGVAAYYDMLGEKAFGNFRDLLEGVALHPMMGVYLSTLHNQKENPVTGLAADENFAREVMQLFTIGLYELNSDGSYKTGSPVDTYGTADIKGLAKVMTGWSWYAGPHLADRNEARFLGKSVNLERDWRPMQAYNAYHSTSEKKFLGLTIPAGAADAEADLKIALDRLFNHPNVGPNLGRQLIQRLVTSNPSPAYIGRVAAVFNDNGTGVRGDMKAVFRAVLLDSEARSVNASDVRFGKVREPLLRLSSLLRAFNAKSTSGRYAGLDDTDSPAGALGQTALRAPSVFNFYRPNYTPRGATTLLYSPELQLTNEVSVAGYLNYLRDGWLLNTTRDIQPDFSAELALADDAAALIDRINLLLMSGQMSTALRSQIIAGINGRAIPVLTASNHAQIDAAKRDRVRIAVFLTMASPDYLVQK